MYGGCAGVWAASLATAHLHSQQGAVVNHPQAQAAEGAARGRGVGGWVGGEEKEKEVAKGPSIRFGAEARTTGHPIYTGHDENDVYVSQKCGSFYKRLTHLNSSNAAP